MKIFYPIALALVLFSCKENEHQKENNLQQNKVTTNDNTKTTNKNEESKQQSNYLIGKHFYVCTSVDNQFDNFFKEDSYFNVLYFKDKNTVVHYMNTGSWSPVKEGQYKFENDELYIKVSTLVSGHNVLKGKLKKLTKTNYILMDTGISGQDIEELKLINFTPQ